MLKSQLRKIIKESIKELMNEHQIGHPPVVHTHGSNPPSPQPLKPPTCYSCANSPNYVLANEHVNNNNQYTIQGNIAMGYSTPTIVSGPAIQLTGGIFTTLPPTYIYPSWYWTTSQGNYGQMFQPNMIGNNPGNPCNSRCLFSHISPNWGNPLHILGCTDPSYVAACNENQPWCPNGTITQSDPNWGHCLECTPPTPWNNITGTDCECCDDTPPTSTWKCAQLGSVAEQVNIPVGCVEVFDGSGQYGNEQSCLNSNSNIPNGCGGGTGPAKIDKPDEPTPELEPTPDLEPAPLPTEPKITEPEDEEIPTDEPTIIKKSQLKKIIRELIRESI